MSGGSRIQRKESVEEGRRQIEALGTNYVILGFTESTRNPQVVDFMARPERFELPTY
jgi:hypothetical protein